MASSSTVRPTVRRVRGRVFDISIRYIEASIQRAERGRKSRCAHPFRRSCDDDPDAAHRSRPRRSGTRAAAPRYTRPPCAGTPTTRWPVGPSSVTSATGRVDPPRRLRRPPRAGAGGSLRGGEGARRPARCASGSGLAYVSYVYGDGLRAANGRCISHPGELEQLGETPRRVHLLPRRGLPRLRLEPPGPP